MKYAVFTLFIFVFLGLYAPLSAQVNTYQSNVEVEMVPENPGPNEVVNVSLNSFDTDINSATIIWEVNDVVKKSGRGEKKFVFTTGGMNTSTTLHVVVQTIGGEIIEKTINIRPVQIDMFWESDALVPPFYKGKSYFSHQNEITFIAFPHIGSPNGGEIPPKNLVYKWSQNGKAMDEASGYGRSTYTFTGSVISRALDVKVEVSSPDTGGFGFARSTVNPIEPSVLFYKKSPLYGIEFQKALVGTIELNDSKELAVIGMPFFFGNGGGLNYKWAINGLSINSDPSQTTQVFRQKEGTYGTSKISLSIENDNKVLQYASKNFSLKFGKPDESNTSI